MFYNGNYVAFNKHISNELKSPLMRYTMVVHSFSKKFGGLKTKIV